jgi:hypothetical protein
LSHVERIVEETPAKLKQKNYRLLSSQFYPQIPQSVKPKLFPLELCLWHGLAIMPCALVYLQNLPFFSKILHQFSNVSILFSKVCLKFSNVFNRFRTFGSTIAPLPPLTFKFYACGELIEPFYILNSKFNKLPILPTFNSLGNLRNLGP